VHLVVGTFCYRPATGEKVANKIWFIINERFKAHPTEN
jgi:hypothetical protein